MSVATVGWGVRGTDPRAVYVGEDEDANEKPRYEGEGVGLWKFSLAHKIRLSF